MPDRNDVVLCGALGRDPELRHFQTGTACLTLSVATTEKWVKNGEEQKRTEWHRVSVFGEMGERLATQLQKGSRVFVMGSLHTRSWDDKDHPGKKRFATEVIAREAYALREPRSASAGNLRLQEQQPRPAQPAADEDDSIPF